MNIEIVKFDTTFLEYSWKWLNDPEIREMTNTPYFNKKEQENWYHRLLETDNYLIWGIQIDKTPIGACGLKNISKIDCEYWGYIGEKEYWGNGVGSFILQKLIEKAIEMKIQSIWLKVLKSNKRAIRLYEKMEFSLEKELDSFIYMRKRLY